MNEDSYDRVDVPDFTQVLAQRIALRQSGTTPTAAPNGFDPYKALVDKKKADNGEPVDTSNIQQWPEKDVKALEDFCSKHGVFGYSCGKMSPTAALAMLKGRMGIVDGPLESRVPPGYEKMGNQSKYNASFPYEQVVSKKTLLNG